jgi:hypothetical protein
MKREDPTKFQGEQAAYQSWQAEQRELSHEESEGCSPVDRADPAEVLRKFINFALGETADSKARWAEIAGKRLIALATVLEIGPCAGRSLQEVAEKAGCTRALLSHYCVTFSKEAGINFRRQKTAEAREKYAKGTKGAWGSGRMRKRKGPFSRLTHCPACGEELPKPGQSVTSI